MQELESMWDIELMKRGLIGVELCEQMVMFLTPK